MSQNGDERLLDHFRASADEHWVVLKWKKCIDDPLRVAVLRSEEGFAESVEAVFAEPPTQQVVYEGDGDSCQDQDVAAGVRFFYTCFARRDDGLWQRQHTDKIKPPQGVRHLHRTDLGSTEHIKAVDRLRMGLTTGAGFGGGGL
jgi:hypothetical protein